jgi:prevent-host-death family protein
METYGIRDLQRRPSEIVDRVDKTGRPALVTRRGRPAAVLMPLDEDALEDFVLANAPEFVASIDEAERDLRAGRSRPAAEVIAQIERDERGRRG